MTAPQNIHQRLHAAMRKVDYIQREHKRGMNYTIVSHDAVTAKVRPVLVECGIVYYPVALEYRQDGNRTEVALSVRFANIDDPADHIDVPALGYGVDQQDKGPGKAISFAVKYALLKALGLETGDEPDAEDIDHVPAKAPPAKQPPASKAPTAAEPDEGTVRRANAIKAAIDKSRDAREVNQTMGAYSADLESLPATTRKFLEDRAEKRRGLLAQGAA